MTKRKRWAMRDLVTDEIVETAARAYHEAASEAVAGSWDVSTPRIRERGLARARAALEAAAPLIEATALREAAEDWRRGHTFSVMEDWLRARADQIEKEDA